MTSLHWDSISQKIAAIEPFIPESGGNLGLLVQDLAAIDRLDLPRDRRLMGIDLTNLMEGIDRLTAMRQEGYDTQDLAQASVRLTALALDMRVRAAHALHNEAQSIALHADVASSGLADQPVLDLTDRFQTVVAAPAPAAGPGVLAPTGYQGDDSTFGRLEGSFFTILREALPNRAAPKGAVILPQGAVARFQPGQSFFLYSSGAKNGDRFDAPSVETPRIIWVEAREETTLYGPAILAPAPQRAYELSRIAQDVFNFNKAMGSITKARKKLDKIQSILEVAIWGAISLGGAALGIELSRGLSPEEGVTIIGGSIFAFLMLGYFLGIYSASLIRPRLEKRLFKRMAHLLPERFHTRAMIKHIQDCVPSIKLNIPAEKSQLPSQETLEHLTKVLRQHTAVNIIPVNRIENEPGHPLPVMRPLVALPAPAKKTQAA